MSYLFEVNPFPATSARLWDVQIGKCAPVKFPFLESRLRNLSRIQSGSES